MLTISPPAYERLSEMLAGRSNDIAVRIVMRRGRARIRPGRQRDDDKVIMHGGRAVIVLDPQVARRLEDRTIGIRETDHGPRLHLKPVVSGDDASL